MEKTSLFYWIFIVTGFILIIWLKSQSFNSETIVTPSNSVQPYKHLSVENYITNKWNIDQNKAREIITHAAEHTDNLLFPTLHDTLAIIAIESGFNQFAVSSANAKGLMQILYKPTTFKPSDNIKDGVSLLKEYKEKLHSTEAAVQSYNVGIGNYLNGMRNYKYLTKFKHERNQLRKYE